MDTIERLRRTVSETLAEPIREIVEDAVGEVVDHHIRRAMEALQAAPWPDKRTTRRRPVGSLERALASSPAVPPRAGAGASARDSEEPVEVPPPRIARYTGRGTRAEPIVEERRNGRVMKREGDAPVAAYVKGPDGRYPDGRERRRASTNATPDPIDGPVNTALRKSTGKDYAPSDTVGAKGDPTIAKGQRTKWILEYLAKHGTADYVTLTPVQYPDLGDTRYARKLSSINISRLAKTGAIERVPDTFRPTIYRLPNP